MTAFIHSVRHTLCAHVFLVAGLFVGSGHRSEVPGKPQIALIMKSLANEFFLTMEKGARRHQQRHASEYELLTNGIKDELDVSKQIDLVEQMIAQRVSAIVLAPADSKALVSVCKAAQDAGVIVVNIDNKLDQTVLADKGLRIPFVGPDNRKGARLVGEYLGKHLKRGDKVAILEGVPNAFNSMQRRLGFDEAVTAAGLQLATSQSASWESGKANQLVSAMITEQPDLKGILCANDSMALGAVAALKTAGKADQVKVAGFDNISAAQLLIREGKMLATADQHGDQLAVYGIEYALEILKQRAQPADRETPVDLITAKSLESLRVNNPE
jgi:ribose transport system substrate-binding protein